MPGVVSGTLLTFIPASGDYVNADLLGSTDTFPHGRKRPSRAASSSVTDYPTAAALSFVLMAIDPGDGAGLGAGRGHGSADGSRGAMSGVASRRAPRLRPVAHPRLAPSGRRLLDRALNVYAGLALLYLLLPIVVIVLFSFNDTQSRFNFVWHGLHARQLGAPVRRRRASPTR